MINILPEEWRLNARYVVAYKKITFRGSRYKIRLFSRQLYSSRCFLLSVYYISLPYFLRASHGRSLPLFLPRATAQGLQTFNRAEFPNCSGFFRKNTVSLNRILKFFGKFGRLRLHTSLERLTRDADRTREFRFRGASESADFGGIIYTHTIFTKNSKQKALVLPFVTIISPQPQSEPQLCLRICTFSIKLYNHKYFAQQSMPKVYRKLYILVD